MREKIKLLIVYNILFYVFIVLHKFYTDDYVPQVLFYIFLAFSADFMEKAFSKKIVEIKLYTFIDLSLRIITLGIHFIGLINETNIKVIIMITLILFIINLLIEIEILNNKNLSYIDIGLIKQKEINKFIEDFYSEKKNISFIDNSFKDDLKNILKATNISGQSTIIITILSIAAILFRYLNKYYSYYTIIAILIILILLCILCRLSYKQNKLIYESKNKIRRKSKINNISFIIGYVILFLYSVYLHNKLGYFNITVLVIGALFWIPVINTKIIIKRKIEEAYKEYRKLINLRINVNIK